MVDTADFMAGWFGAVSFGPWRDNPFMTPHHGMRKAVFLLAEPETVGRVVRRFSVFDNGMIEFAHIAGYYRGERGTRIANKRLR